MREWVHDLRQSAARELVPDSHELLDRGAALDRITGLKGRTGFHRRLRADYPRGEGEIL